MKIIHFIFFLLVCKLNAQSGFNLKSIDSIIDNQVKDKYEIALQSLNNELKIEKKTKTKQILYAKKATILLDQNKINEAQKTITFAQKLCESIHCYPQKASLNFQQAQVYFKSNKVAKALEIILENNLMLQKYNPNAKELINSYAIAAYYYNILEDYKNAELNLEKSLQLDKKLHPKKEFASIYNNLGILARKQKKWHKALLFFNQTLQEDLKAKNNQNNIYTYNNIASVYLELSKLDSAYFYLNKVNQKADAETLLNSSVYVNYCVYFNRKNQVDSTLFYGHKFLNNFSKKSGQLDKAALVYKQLSELFEKTNQADSSLFYHKKLLELKELQWYSTERDEIVSKAEEKAKTQYQTQVIEALEQKAYFQNLSIKQERFLLYSLLTLFGLAVCFVVLFYYFRNIKNQKKQIELEQKILRSQMNPHFIFNALTAIQNKVMENNPLNTATYISRFAKLIRQNFNFTQKEFITLEEDLDALKNYMATQQMRFENKFDFQFNIHQDINPSFIQIPPMLLQPFVENAIEHGFKDLDYKGNIEISVHKKNDQQIEFKITDNGKGFYPKSDEKLHAIDIIKTRLKLNNSKDSDTFYIKNNTVTSGTIVFFTLTLTSK